MIATPIATTPLPQNAPHQRMAGEEYACQHANHRYSAAWDCSHLRFIAICDSIEEQNFKQPDSASSKPTHRKECDSSVALVASNIECERYG